MFTVSNNTVRVNRAKKLSARQLNALKRMSDGQKNNYLASLLGLSKAWVDVPRLKKIGADALARKGAGRTLRLLEQLTRVDQQHKPTQADVGHWIGVEIECFLPHALGQRVTAFETLKRTLQSNRVKRCEIKHDGSLLSDRGYPVELTLLINTRYGFGDLERLCLSLSQVGAFVNRTCGLHVHFDARAMGARGAGKFGRSIGHALPVLSQMVPPSRRTNNYCQMGVSTLDGDRYYAVNLTAYQKYGTVEVRLHSGTTDYAKIKNWIDLLKLIGDRGLIREVRDLQSLIDKVEIPEALAEYIDRRITNIAERNPNSTTVENDVA